MYYFLQRVKITRLPLQWTTPQKVKAICIFSQKVIIYVWKKQNLEVYNFTLIKEFIKKVIDAAVLLC